MCTHGSLEGGATRCRVITCPRGVTDHEPRRGTEKSGTQETPHVADPPGPRRHRAGLEVRAVPRLSRRWRGGRLPQRPPAADPPGRRGITPEPAGSQAEGGCEMILPGIFFECCDPFIQDGALARPFDWNAGR